MVKVPKPSDTGQRQPRPDAESPDPAMRRTYNEKRKSALWTERASWDGAARDMASLLLPRASRFTTSETNKGTPKHNKIYDNTALRAVRVGSAGMMSGLTSPARPWMRAKHPDDDLMQYEPVKVWCSEVTRRILAVCAKSNVYRTLHQTYTELFVFGTHAAIFMPNQRTLIHGTALTWGEYTIALDNDGRADTLYREMAMTAVNMCRQFGYENCSAAVRAAYDRGNLDSRFDVVHAIEPRQTYDGNKMDVQNMPFRSAYFEMSNNTKGQFLRESGFRRFRAVAPRWQATSLDTYGESPGMECIGDTKQLQHEQYRKAQGIDYMTQPPVGLPTASKGQETNMLPGGASYFDTPNGASGQRQLFDVKLDLNDLREDIGDVRSRINSSMYVDLFLMLSSMDNGGGKMTATEVAERHEEKLLMLGPVLERLHNELIDPLVDLIFEQLVENNALPPPPPELEGQPIEIELISMLAQAQRAVQTNGMDRLLMGVAQIGQLGKPEVADKINGDAMVDGYADSYGTDPRFINDDRKVAAIREQRAKAQQAAQQAAAVSQAADQAKALGTVPTQGGSSNAGADVINMFSGYGNPSPERVMPGE